MKFRRSDVWNTISFKVHIGQTDNNFFNFKPIVEEKIRLQEGKECKDVNIIDIDVQYDTTHSNRSVAFGGYAPDLIKGSVAFVTVTYSL